MYCNKCGFKFEGNFCPSCGAKAKTSNLVYFKTNNNTNTATINKSTKTKVQENPFAHLYEKKESNFNDEIPKQTIANPSVNADTISPILNHFPDTTQINTKQQRDINLYTPVMKATEEKSQQIPVAPINCVSPAQNITVSQSEPTNSKAEKLSGTNSQHRSVADSQPVNQTTAKEDTIKTQTPEPKSFNTRQGTDFHPHNATQPNVDCEPQKTSQPKDECKPQQTAPTDKRSEINHIESFELTKTHKRKGLRLWQILLIVLVAILTVTSVGILIKSDYTDFYELIEYEFLGNSETKTVKVGETLKSEYFSYCVTEIEEIEAFEGATPDEACHFLAVTVKIKNTQNYSNYPDCEISVYNGNEKCKQMLSNRYDSYQGNLLPDKSMTTTYIFEVPDNAKNTNVFISYDYDNLAQIHMD